MNYYPNDIVFKEWQEQNSTVFDLFTTLRLKSDQGFYYLCKVRRQYNAATILKESKAQVISGLYKAFIKDVENTRNNFKYPGINCVNTNNEVICPIDSYQGEVDEYNPKLMFQYYDPSWSIDELLGVNEYMKEFINYDYGK